MRAAWPVPQIRAAEHAVMAGQAEGVLMQKAATALAVECVRLLVGTVGGVYARRVVLLVGAGGNGGDTLFAGAQLARRGAEVRAILLAPDRAHPAGLAAFLAAGGRVVPIAAAESVLGRADLVVDGILGIGGRGGLRDEAAGLLVFLERGSAVVVAVDVPSGVDADTGVVAGAAVRADVTVTFGALKPGLLVGAGAEHVGELRMADIGLDVALPEPAIRVLEAADVASALRPPSARDDKYTRGVVGVVAGSAQYAGAAVLCTGAALHGGAGMVRYAGTAADAVRARWPEVVIQDLADAGRVQAWVIGPGLSTSSEAMAQLEFVLTQDVPVLVDADGITLLAQRRELLAQRRAPTVLTPHDREFERLFGAVGPDRIAAARRATAESGAVVLLKGNATVVAAPASAVPASAVPASAVSVSIGPSDQDVWVNRTGTPWLATAGSGDVLSGLIGSVLAAGHEPAQAAALGAYVHGVAGQLAGADGPPSAADILAAVRHALHAL